MIEVQNLSKHYGDKAAVNNISFTANDGEILGFLGPNGAGKSTTMNMLTGYISSTSGKALINGIDILEDPIKPKKNIGYLPELPPLYMDMTVKEYLNFIYDLKKCKLPRVSHLKDICGLVKIDHVYNRVIRNLSKGYRQRVGVAQALVGNPPVLILDEATSSIDTRTERLVQDGMDKLMSGRTTFVIAHRLSTVRNSDCIMVLEQGRIIERGSHDKLIKEQGRYYQLYTGKPAKKAAE